MQRFNLPNISASIYHIIVEFIDSRGSREFRPREATERVPVQAVEGSAADKADEEEQDKLHLYVNAYNLI